ncbi:MAG: Smr/MutS family protein [Spirochaetales bacterium]|nr:Smr/MutS family protein [Spirochaetales bacterium]
MSRTGVVRLTTNNPFTPEESSFADLLEGCDLDVGVFRHLQEKKALAEAKKPKGIKGYPPVQDVLDLHGDTALASEQKAMLFVQTSIGRGLQTVRIITGKGLHSPGGVAVLPDVVEAQLTVLKHDGVIFNFVWDKQLKAKSGSILVYL